MKQLTYKQQRGAVLAFSLVMLLLLTLVSLSMIRQNKAQINIASNTGQQVKAFAAVETALRQVQGAVNTKRYQDQANHHCKAGNQINEGDMLVNTTGLQAEVSAIYCVSNYALKGSPPRYSGDEARCYYTSGGARDSQPLTNTTATDSQRACGRLDNAGGWVAGQVWTATNPNPRCQIEEYTLNVTIDDQVTHANRTVESKFQVDCSGDLN